MRCATPPFRWRAYIFRSELSPRRQTPRHAAAARKRRPPATPVVRRQRLQPPAAEPPVCYAPHYLPQQMPYSGEKGAARRRAGMIVATSSRREKEVQRERKSAKRETRCSRCKRKKVQTSTQRADIPQWQRACAAPLQRHHRAALAERYTQAPSPSASACLQQIRCLRIARSRLHHMPFQRPLERFRCQLRPLRSTRR